MVLKSTDRFHFALNKSGCIRHLRKRKNTPLHERGAFSRRVPLPHRERRFENPLPAFGKGQGARGMRTTFNYLNVFWRCLFGMMYKVGSFVYLHCC